MLSPLPPSIPFLARLAASSLLSIAGAALFILLAAGGAGAAQGDCSQPQSNGNGPNTSDCAFILKAAVGSKDCELCVCDVNGNNNTSTTDALVCLKRAVGQSVPLDCPSCGPTTTTSGNVSTTSTSTTSSTTTIPVRCTGNSDCSDLPSGFRCNPNTDSCEKPCTKNTDCHLFYDCNKTTGYCQEPLLQF